MERAARVYGADAGPWRRRPTAGLLANHHRDDTMKTTTSALLVAALGAAGLASLTPAAAGAQNRVGLELRGGAGLPAFDLADRADPGAAFGLDLTYRLADRVALLAGGDVELLRGAEPAGSDLAFQDLTAWHYALGVEAQLLEPRTTYWRLRAGAGAGGSTYDADGGDSRAAFSLYGSLKLGYEFSPEADFFVGVRSWLAFAEQEEVAVAGSPPDPAVFPPPDPLSGVEGAAWSFPVTAGIRFHF